PDVQLLSEVKNGEERTLTLRLIANRNEHVDLIAPPDSRLRAAGLDGFVRRIDQESTGKYSVSCFGRSCDGATFELRMGRLKPVDFVVLGGSGGLPPTAMPLLKERPNFARPQYN